MARIIEQLAHALAAAHRVGIIHRDLKPENIVYDPKTQQAKLLDFGIARDAQQDAAERLTRTGFFVGTLQYVAPEALSGELVGEAADVYSLATIAYYLLTLQHPFRGRTQRELFQHLLKADPLPIREAAPSLAVPDGLERVIMTGLSRNPSNRPPSVLSFAEQIQSAMGEASLGAPSPVKGSSLRELWRRISRNST